MFAVDDWPVCYPVCFLSLFPGTELDATRAETATLKTELLEGMLVVERAESELQRELQEAATAGKEQLVAQEPEALARGEVSAAGGHHGGSAGKVETAEGGAGGFSESGTSLTTFLELSRFHRPHAGAPSRKATSGKK